MSAGGMEPIVSRMIRLNQLILGKGKQDVSYHHLAHRDSLLDALFALYDECNSPAMKKHRHINGFVDKFKPLMNELRTLRVSVSDFEVKKVIGRGHFGEVQVVREKVTGDVYAMKTLRKAETLVQCVAFFREERDIMALSKSPWLTKLQYAFQDNLNLYLIMEFHPGGDMLSLLEKYKYFSEEMAVFYLAELVLAIHDVHCLGYAHRDIKPDNILLDRTGHIKLADFGSASKLNHENLVADEMPVGTPDYIAPEILISISDKPMKKKKGYGIGCDWWSFGIVAYEMLYGATPFTDEKVLNVYNNIMNFNSSLQFPEEISQPFEDLIKQLLTDASSRIGYQSLITHPVFEEIDWNSIREKPPPFVPTVTSQDDTSNFDDFDHDSRPCLSELQSKQEFSGKNLPFVGFTYTALYESSHRRCSSIDDSIDSPVRTSLPGSDGTSRKRALTELQSQISKLTDKNQSLKNELNSMKCVKKRDEEEIMRLNSEISKYQVENKELMRLLRLERQDRVLTEKKTSQILKCMKMRKMRQYFFDLPVLRTDVEDSSSSPEVSSFEQKDEVTSSLAQNLTEHHYFPSLTSRAKSLSPQPLNMDCVDDSSKVSDSIRMIKRENSMLKRELKKVEQIKGEDSISQLEELKGAVVKLESDLRKAVSGHDNSQVSEMLSTLEKELSVKHNIISKLQKDLMTAEDEIASLKLRLTTTEEELQEARFVNEETEQSLEIVKGELKDLQSQNDELRKAAAESNGKSSESLKTIKRENSILRKELKKLEQDQKEEYASQMEQFRSAITKLENDLQKTKQECPKVLSESTSSQITEMLSTLEKELDVKHNIISGLQKDLLTAQDDVSSLKHKLEVNEEKLSKLRLTKDEAQKSVEVMECKIRDQQLQIEELQKTLDQRSWSTVDTEVSNESSGSTKNLVPIEEFLNLKTENETLLKKIDDLEKQQELLKTHSRQVDKSSSFEKQLKEKEDALSEAKLDLRIALREKKRLEEMSSAFRESNRELRSKLADAESKVVEKTKLEKELRDEIKDLEVDVNKKKWDISEKIRIYESQKNVSQMYVKNQDRIEEVTKQNEMLKCEQHMQESEKSQLLSQIKKLESSLAAKELEYSNVKKVMLTLKKTSTELEEQLKDFEFLEKDHEDELSILRNENKKLLLQKKELEKEIASLSSSCRMDKKAREQLEQQLENLEEEIENQHSVHEVEIQNLQDTISHLKDKIGDLESNLAEAEKDMSTHDQEAKHNIRKAISLESEIISLKEESSKLITQIASLKKSNLQLTQDLEEVLESEREALKTVEELRNEIESNEAANNHERLKLQETVSQQTKLIDFLQVKIENMEKKKKSLSVPRLFTRKDNTLNMAWQEAEGRELEKTRCRRLQDQLSQARVEIMSLKKELSQKAPRTPLVAKSAATIPISPLSRAMHSALMASPSTNGDGDSPLLMTRESSNRYSKMQGMKYRIPHRFYELTCMKGHKCAACLGSIHFGRLAAKCQECGAICHPKCATSLPSTCGIPTGFVQHFKSEYNKNPSLKVSELADDSKHEGGWIKVPKNNKQGWERRYMCIKDSMLCLFESPDTEDLKLAIECLDFATQEGEIMVISAVSAAELACAAQSDLPFVLKVVYCPFTTCWPPRTLYLMAESFSDKQMWVDILEATIAKYKTVCRENSNNKLTGETILKLKNDRVLDVQCAFLMDEDTLLLGTIEGLYVVPMSNNSCGSLMSKINGIDNVYQITWANDIGLMIFICGQEKNLKSTTMDALNASILERIALPLEKVSDLQDCHLFAVQETRGSGPPHLCSAAGNSVTLFLWNSSSKTFCKRKVIEAREPCSCFHFTQSSAIFGCDKFYELDLKTCAIEEFLDCTDTSLAALVYGVSQIRSFPVAIFHIAAVNQPEEYLVCFHEFGVFVDGFGQKTRSEDMKWSRLPLAFAYRAPYLFMTHFNTLEVVEILPPGSEEKPVHGIMEIPNPHYLGPAANHNSIFISSHWENHVEVLSVAGNSVSLRKVDQDSSSSERCSRTESRSSKESADDEGLDFSLNNSFLLSLDTQSTDNLSMTSGETPNSEEKE